MNAALNSWSVPCGFRAFRGVVQSKRLQGNPRPSALMYLGIGNVAPVVLQGPTGKPPLSPGPLAGPYGPSPRRPARQLPFSQRAEPGPSSRASPAVPASPVSPLRKGPMSPAAQHQLTPRKGCNCKASLRSALPHVLAWTSESDSTSPAGVKRRTGSPCAQNSRCLKLYCECFSSGRYCLPSCNCVSCYNNRENETRRQMVTVNDCECRAMEAISLLAQLSVPDASAQTPTDTPSTARTSWQRTELSPFRRQWRPYSTGTQTRSGPRSPRLRTVRRRPSTTRAATVASPTA